jgi:hypothetical protein
MKHKVHIWVLLAVALLATACGKDEEELAARAVGSYTYTVAYYSKAADAVVDYSGDGWPKMEESKGSGTLKVTVADDASKLTIAMDDGWSFTTSKVESDAVINPTGSFTFTIPQHTINAAGVAKIEGTVISINPDGEKFQGSFGLSTDEDWTSNYDLWFGLKINYTDKTVKYARFMALSGEVDLEEELNKD